MPSRATRRDNLNQLPLSMKIHFITFGCKANQYDTEKFRQEFQARGAEVVDSPGEADACVVNTCTVTNRADAVARKAIRRVKRDHPDVRVLVAGCSAALHPAMYHEMEAVDDVVGGHDAVKVAERIAPEAPLLERHEEPIGARLLERNERGTRAWMKIQDGCDRRCSFCATRLARGASRSRQPDELVEEAKKLAQHHAEIVFTGIHIGHYGRDLRSHGDDQTHTLASLAERLLAEVPKVRFRLGSIEATEIDDHLLDLLATSEGRLVPHLHIPMQAGSDNVLRAMRRWHTREQYRSRVLEIADRLPYLGLGADVIVGFPGESDDDFAQTRELVEELPFTYLHVFPYSERDGTAAVELSNKVHSRVAAARSKELRDIAMQKGTAYRQSRAGDTAQVIVESTGRGLTEDYLRVDLEGVSDDDVGRLITVSLSVNDDGELSAPVEVSAII